jgi:plasmid stabilization system protein ParE
MRNLIIRPAAVADLRIAAAWYADIDLALRDRYIAEADFVFSRVKLNPAQYSSWPSRPAFHRAFFRSFPYLAIYTFDEIEVAIIAVVHAKKLP